MRSTIINKIDVPTATTEIIAATFIDANKDETEAMVASCVAKLTFENATEIRDAVKAATEGNLTDRTIAVAQKLLGTVDAREH